VKLPSVLDNAEYGESALNYPLAYDHIEPVPIELAGNRKELFKSELREQLACAMTRSFRILLIAKNRIQSTKAAGAAAPGSKLS
jgi:hypothetical protein